jgi:hypothetical protein
MKADDEQDAGELTALERQFQDELPQICMVADVDLLAALVALDGYLGQTPPDKLKKSLLTWKGLFYLEHGMHDDAVRELRAADALNRADELSNFNTKFDLAKALELGGNPREAYAVLTAAVEEIHGPDLVPGLLRAMARIAASAGLSVPPCAEAALNRVSLHYGLDAPPPADLAAVMARVADLVEGASARFSMLEDALKEADEQAQKIRLIEEYLDRATVPYYRHLAEDLRHRV